MRVLVVEDEVKIARAIRRGLEHEGYATDVATTGQDAIHQATEHDYDAVVLDVKIPEPDGFAVCRQMRARNRWAPVLMLTARDSVDDRIQGLDAGADDYLIKPFAFGELLARLRALLRRAPAERPSIIRAGDVALDPAAHVVTRAGKLVELTGREFALLEFLMRHTGQVLTRTAMLEHVWGCDYDGDSNVVDVYIGYLRRKLEGPPVAPLIKTIRGVGYILDATSAAGD
jgi:two-component system, OmpR family, response regulator